MAVGGEVSFLLIQADAASRRGLIQALGLLMEVDLQPVEPLSQVVFVHDYLQLVFQDRALLSTTSPPTQPAPMASAKASRASVMPLSHSSTKPLRRRGFLTSCCCTFQVEPWCQFPSPARMHAALRHGSLARLVARPLWSRMPNNSFKPNLSAGAAKSA